MDEITLEHGVSMEKVKKLVGGTRHYTVSGSVQLGNTLMHAKAEEVNKGNRGAQSKNAQRPSPTPNAQPRDENWYTWNK
jgi:hypothetical protein